MPEAALTFGDELDFSLLSGSDDYSRYFASLIKACELLLATYEHDQSEATFEAQKVSTYLERLLYTVYVLRLKYTHSPAHRRDMWVDLSASGFPNAQEISLISVDLLNRSKRLQELPTTAILKQQVLDYLFKYQQEPAELLWQLSERSYLETLEQSQAFLPFVMSDDDIVCLSGDTQPAMYECAWACYDARKDLPFIHVMSFEQAEGEKLLSEKAANHLHLLEVLQMEGSRVPDVGILAMAIDEALDSIYPKIIKRIGFGPFLTPVLLNQDGLELDSLQQGFKELLELYGEEDDVILFITDEIIFSRNQRLSKSIFASKAKVRQIFHIPESNPEAYRRRASVVHQQVLMPHRIAQHLNRTIFDHPALLKDVRILTYNSRGEVHGR